jgi:hypothetical protein
VAVMVAATGASRSRARRQRGDALLGTDPPFVCGAAQLLVWRLLTRKQSVRKLCG